MPDNVKDNPVEKREALLADRLRLHNKTTANAFMASAQKSKREMADIQKEGSGKHETDEVELKKISLLIPAWLHKEAQLHRVETGESMTKLIVRLLAEELG